MPNNVYLFTGEEQLLLQQEVKRRKQGFEQKNGENSTFVFSSENFDNNQVIQSVFGAGFFSNANLTILKDIPTPATNSSAKYETFINEFLAREGKIPEASFLVFASSNPDKRTKLYKFLKKNATIKEFKKLKKNEIKNLVQQALNPITIANEAQESFVEKIGDDLQSVMHEVDKLQHRCTAQNKNIIQEQDIENITYTYTKQDAFKFFWILFKQQEQRILQFINAMQNESGNRNAFLGSVYWTLNLYLTLLDFFDQGKTSYEDIKNSYKINPFVLKINLGQKDTIMKFRKEIKNMYLQLVELDDAIKNWKKQADEFWIQLKKFSYPFIQK